MKITGGRRISVNRSIVVTSLPLLPVTLLRRFSQQSRGNHANHDASTVAGGSTSPSVPSLRSSMSSIYTRQLCPGLLGHSLTCPIRTRPPSVTTARSQPDSRQPCGRVSSEGQPVAVIILCHRVCRGFRHLQRLRQVREDRGLFAGHGFFTFLLIGVCFPMRASVPSALDTYTTRWPSMMRLSAYRVSASVL